MAYKAPVEDMIFALQEIAGIGGLEGDGYPEFDTELIAPVLEEAGKLASDVLAPLNQTGDAQGAQLTGDGVVAPHGFRDAYKAFAEGGWMGLAAPAEWGGQGLPKTLANAVLELFHGANMSFGLCPMLSLAAIEALVEHGSEADRKKYLPKLVSGEWTGTMNLTEPQAGSDVGALKTKAVPNGDGS